MTVTADAPGRVNLIGEHTDYNDGFVLPTAIPQRTRIELTVRSDRTVRVSSAEIGAPEQYELGAEKPGRGWLDYVQGVTHTLLADGFVLSGFDAKITSDVPLGSGLSSSAALEVSLLRALRTAFGLALDDVTLALVGQRAENGFVGAHVGVMDQMASSLADRGTALFLDTRDLSFERVPLPPTADLVVINSGVAHDLTAGDYNTRRAECEQAAALLGVGSLRDMTEADLPRIARLPDPLNRRVRHVVTENARVLRAVAAMKADDLAELGRLFAASHASMRDDYEVSAPAVDLLVSLAAADPAIHGARLTGGGFGGSIVALARIGTGRAAAARIAAAYNQQTAHHATVLVP